MTKRLLALFALFVLIGCRPAANSSSTTTTAAGNPAEQTYRIAVIPKGTSHEFWKSIHAGAQRAADEAGNVEIVWKGPAKENDTAGQIDVVKNMITQRVDGICLAPNQAGGLIDAVIEANDENIPVVIFDSGLAEGAEYVSYVATDNFKGGRLAAQRLADVLDEKGDVILLRYRVGSESTEQRENGFLDAIAEYPEINVLSSDQYGEHSTMTALEKSKQLLLNFGKEVDGVFAVCEPNCIGMVEALREAGLDGKVKFIAFDPSDALIQGMEEGVVNGIVLQDPVHMGYTAVKTIIACLNGETEFADYVSTGEYVATPENMKEEKYDQLLNPATLD